MDVPEIVSGGIFEDRFGQQWQVKHAEGTLLRAFNIQFMPTNPDVRPWYARF